jgi:hypothetical protein
MARLGLNAVGASRLGVDVTPGTPALTALGANTGVSFTNSGGMLLVVNNGGTVPCVVTENIGQTIEGATPVAPAISIPAGKTWLVGPFHPMHFKSGDGTGLTYVDLAPQASVNVGLVGVSPISPAS